MLAACGAAPPPPAKIKSEPLQPGPYLYAFAAETTALMKPEETAPSELEAQLKVAATGGEKRELMRKLALRAAGEAETAADEKAAKKLRGDSDRWARKAMKAEKDAYLLSDMEFLLLWNAWRGQRAGVAAQAERFTTNHADITELATIAWAIRGEASLEDKQWDAAAQAYRFMFGNLDHPLYAFALYRTAASMEGAGRKEDATQALTEAAAMGCAEGVAQRVLDVSLAAAGELGLTGKRGKDNRLRPSTCKAGKGAGPTEDEAPPEKP